MKLPAFEKRWLVVAAALPLLGVALLAAAGRPAHPPAGGGDLPWQCLDFHAEHLIFKAQTRLCAKKADPAAMIPWLPAKDPHQPALVEAAPGAALFELTVAADIVGRKSEEQMFFEPASGRVLQRTKVKLGDDPYRKSYRFGREALEWTRSAPHNRAETASGENAWTKIENLSAAYPAGAVCRVYSEPVLLLFLAATHDWQAEKKLELCFFASKHWSRVEATSSGREAFRASFERNGQPQEVKEAEVIVLKAFDASPEAGGDPFELMGLRGDIRIYLEPESGLPLAIRGEMPWVGEVTVHLEKAEIGS